MNLPVHIRGVLSVLLLAGCGVWPLRAAELGESHARPNIVFILIDDLFRQHELTGVSNFGGKRAELSARLDAWLGETSAQMPVPRNLNRNKKDNEL